MSKLKNLKIAATVISVIFACVYLTYIIDAQTLNSWLKRIFIFAYFIVMSCVALYLYGRYCKHKITVIPLICAVLLVILGQNFFLPSKADHTVYVQAVENGEQEYKEVWLVDVELDGNKRQLSSLQMNDVVQWTYMGGNDDYCFLPTDNSEGNVLSFTVVGNEVKLSFGANSWSGSVRIFDGESVDEIISLNPENAESDRIDYTLSIVKEYNTAERIIFSIGAIAVMCYVFKLLYAFVFRFVDKHRKKKQ